MPSASLRAYSAFFIEWMETASVIVSTKPDVPPVIRILKLGIISFVAFPVVDNSLSDPTTTFFVFPNPLELSDELYGKLLLSQVSTGLNNDRNAVPMC